jgi:hypothetical protein
LETLSEVSSKDVNSSRNGGNSRVFSHSRDSSSTAVKTTAAARTPATVEIITTADVVNIIAEDSLPVFSPHCLFLHSFLGFSIAGTCRVFTNPCLSF